MSPTIRRLHEKFPTLAYFSRRLMMLRANEWWEFKLVPAMAVVYATAIKVDVSIASVWASILVLLIALGSGAAFVSLLNDASDLADDAAAGKPNRLAGRSKTFVAAVTGVPIVIGLAIGMWWRADHALLTAYLGAWTAFILYSVPPLRLKRRGIWGLLADSAGAHVFPGLMAALVVYGAAGLAADPIWLSAIACWSMAYGARGILWHQLADAHNDRAASVQTFVVANSPQRAVALARYLILPVECAALALLLWRLGEVAPVIALGAYGVLVIGRIVYFQMRPIIVETKPRYLIVFQEFYMSLLPLSLLILAALRHPVDGFVLVAHCLLFPRAVTTTSVDVMRIAVRCMYGHRLK